MSKKLFILLKEFLNYFKFSKTLQFFLKKKEKYNTEENIRI